MWQRYSSYSFPLSVDFLASICALRTPRISMSNLIDIAPAGDLVVGLGKNRARKIVRVSTEILKFGSPVFKIMFGAGVRQPLHHCYLR